MQYASVTGGCFGGGKEKKNKEEKSSQRDSKEKKINTTVRSAGQTGLWVCAKNGILKMKMIKKRDTERDDDVLLFVSDERAL